MLLSQLLQLHDIDTIVLERRSEDYVLSRVRAGVLERGTVDLVRRARANERMDREGLVHEGVELCFADTRHRVDFRAGANSSVLIYGQTELTRDLVEARRAMGGRLVYEAEQVRIEGADTRRPRLYYVHEGKRCSVDCDFVAGCDGFHGVSRQSMPAGAVEVFERTYPFAWLGVMADTPPVSDELIYVNHERGFALCSMRSTTRSRCYIQCRPDEDAAAWSDARFWDEFALRLPAEVAAKLQMRPSIEKGVASLRSFVAEPMRYGRLFIAGDAAHIVPATGAKGLNLAASDIHYLSEALIAFYADRDEAGLDAYSPNCLRRVWKAERFSWWMTSLLHKFPEHSAFDRRIQLAELEYVSGSAAAQAAFAENYVGLPM